VLGGFQVFQTTPAVVSNFANPTYGAAVNRSTYAAVAAGENEFKI
jgi:hypothetical protein